MYSASECVTTHSCFRLMEWPQLTLVSFFSFRTPQEPYSLIAEVIVSRAKWHARRLDEGLLQTCIHLCRRQQLRVLVDLGGTPLSRVRRLASQIESFHPSGRDVGYIHSVNFARNEPQWTLGLLLCQMRAR